MTALRKRDFSFDFVSYFLLWLAAWLMPARKTFAASALGRGETLRLSLDVARVLGADEALILQKMHDWLEYNKTQRRNYHGGRTWTYNSYEAWQRDHFGWLSVSSVKRILLKLEKCGVLMSGHFGAPGDRTKWYTINYQKLSALLADGRPIMEQPSSQNGLMVGLKRADDSTNKNTKKSKSATHTETTPSDARAQDVDGDDVSLHDSGEESLTKEPETPRFEDDRHAKADYNTNPLPIPQGFPLVRIDLWNEHARYTDYILIGDTSVTQKAAGYVDSAFKKNVGASELPEIIKSCLSTMVKKLQTATCQNQNFEMSTLTNLEVSEEGLYWGLDLQTLQDTFSSEFTFSMSLQVDRLTILVGNAAFVICTANSTLFSKLIVSCPDAKAGNMWRGICKSFAQIATNVKPITCPIGDHNQLPQNVTRLVRDYHLNPTTAADYVTKYGAAYADRVAVVARQGSAPAGLWRALLDRGDYKDADAGSGRGPKIEGKLDDFLVR